ncbi:dolichol-phosphate mannosyltransferase/undecaprenyl-phosphate 4-deoxy-4-formamido-L-arabinose transferase [Nitrosospira briensis]|uniref:Dolichol-phosphate mannosyltransferase/undecaprenyl-phosphate 4-deoxy-4-formamido-L-arabinose transferase n=1 Tax=Nitrosospira briensis TaxID=35799 RepID=A0A1I5BRE8_9PROT|nr:dolichol-phosphate mannosyltransferase/undecaprenyl-phosphate 4-deoxy-4-formamido-L-arabinose transferase [Nitrosospira briensis]
MDNPVSMSPEISIVIPTFNNAAGLVLLADRLSCVVNGTGKSWEVILVDDGSSDNSWRVIEDIARDRPGFRGILLGRNMGQARATLCGIRAATGDIVVTMDDDLQHEPEAMPMLLAELDSDGGYDGLFAWFPDKQHSGLRNLGSRIVRYLNARAFGLGKVKISSYRLMRRQVADFIRANKSSIASPGAMMLAATRHIKSVPIEHHQRAFGRSNYTLISQLRLALTNLFAVSLLPLRLIAGLGIATAMVSAIMVLGTLVRYFTTGFGVPGWATLVILITFFSGMILLSLGVIGEYLLRVLRELQYTDAVPVRRTIGF